MADQWRFEGTEGPRDLTAHDGLQMVLDYFLLPSLEFVAKYPFITEWKDIEQPLGRALGPLSLAAKAKQALPTLALIPASLGNRARSGE